MNLFLCHGNLGGRSQISSYMFMVDPLDPFWCVHFAYSEKVMFKNMFSICCNTKYFFKFSGGIFHAFQIFYGQHLCFLGVPFKTSSIEE